MNRQKFAVILTAIIGMIATFLPWYRIDSAMTLSGMASSGWFTFILYVVVIILTLQKNQKEDMTMGISWMVAAVSLLASFVVLWQMIDIFYAKEGMFSLGGRMYGIPAREVMISYGAWIASMAGVAIPIIAFLFRDRTFRRV